MRKILTALGIILLFSQCSNNNAKPATKDSTTTGGTVVIKNPAVIHYTPPDLSPMDMIYIPSDYPLLKMTGKTNDLPLLRIIYSRPQKQGRKVFGELIKYNEPWRLGANEATEIEIFKPISIQGKTVKAGRYIMYCIPQETKWKLIINSNIYSWGLQQQRDRDITEFEIPVEKNHVIIEYFTIAPEKTGEHTANLIFLWDDIKAKLPISF